MVPARRTASRLSPHHSLPGRFPLEELRDAAKAAGVPDELVDVAVSKVQTLPCLGCPQLQVRFVQPQQPASGLRFTNAAPIAPQPWCLLFKMIPQRRCDVMALAPLFAQLNQRIEAQQLEIEDLKQRLSIMEESPPDEEAPAALPPPGDPPPEDS